MWRRRPSTGRARYATPPQRRRLRAAGRPRGLAHSAEPAVACQHQPVPGPWTHHVSACHRHGASCRWLIPSATRGLLEKRCGAVSCHLAPDLSLLPPTTTSPHTRVSNNGKPRLSSHTDASLCPSTLPCQVGGLVPEREEKSRPSPPRPSSTSCRAWEDEVRGAGPCLEVTLVHGNTTV